VRNGKKHRDKRPFKNTVKLTLRAISRRKKVTTRKKTKGRIHGAQESHGRGSVSEERGRRGNVVLMPYFS